MPPGAPFNSFIHQYPIRVDDFVGLPSSETQTPALHLLTHTHSDHVNGLAAQSFGHRVVCSPDAKVMLLNYEPYYERNLHDMNLRAEKATVFKHLKVDKPVPSSANGGGGGGGGWYPLSRDLLITLPLNTPTDFELREGLVVRITSIDANHCPGAVMYLIEGNRGAVLHTGDFRAEPCFLDSIKRNPFLQPYLAPNGFTTSRSISKRLDVIHLDTASMLSLSDVPTKESAVAGLIELMKFFPSTVYFFINVWTWGYEDILKAIAREFDSPIHFDRYKSGIYKRLTSDPFMRQIIARKDVAVDDVPDEPRKAHSVTGNRVIYINPVSMSRQSWLDYLAETKATLAQDHRGVQHLLVPLSRHSTLPELKSFVSLFKPRRIFPNTLIPGLHGLDWRAMDQMFADCGLAMPSFPKSEHSMAASIQTDLDDVDVALKNLIGEGAEKIAKEWFEEGGRMKAKLGVVRTFLEGDLKDAIDDVLGTPTQAPRHEQRKLQKEFMELSSSPVVLPLKRFQAQESQETNYSSRYGDADEDEKEKTMQLLMGYLPEEKENLDASPLLSPSAPCLLTPLTPALEPRASNRAFSLGDLDLPCSSPMAHQTRVNEWRVTVQEHFSHSQVDGSPERTSLQISTPPRSPVSFSTGAETRSRKLFDGPRLPTRSRAKLIATSSCSNASNSAHRYAVDEPCRFRSSKRRRLTMERSSSAPGSSHGRPFTTVTTAVTTPISSPPKLRRSPIRSITKTDRNSDTNDLALGDADRERLIQMYLLADTSSFSFSSPTSSRAKLPPALPPKLAAEIRTWKVAVKLARSQPGRVKNGHHDELKEKCLVKLWEWEQRQRRQSRGDESELGAEIHRCC